MSKYMKKFIATFIALTFIFNLTQPISGYAQSLEENNFQKEYERELRDMGITEDKIGAINEITSRISTAKDMHEIDSLMKEYHKIVDNTLMSSGKSFYTSSGGTLNLEYTGKLSPISNVIFTKVIYFTPEQTTFYLNAMSKPGFINWAKDEGISVVTGVAAAKIAKYLGVTSSVTSWLIGLPISLTFYILQNLESWDLSDAIDRSNTGKVKLEYFYSTSISWPYYMNHENFEPWNSSYVDVPENYSYTWLKDEYNFD